MTTNKKNKIFFWVFTLLFLLPAAGSGVFELFSNGPQATVQALTLLGYPLFLMKILGFSKLLGALAILTGRIPRMKEWATGGRHGARAHPLYLFYPHDGFLLFFE